MQTFRFTGSYSINTHNSLKHKAISRFYLQLILYASFCAPYKQRIKISVNFASSIEELNRFSQERILVMIKLNGTPRQSIVASSYRLNYPIAFG